MTEKSKVEMQKFAYEITQKLTYYIITAELVFSGYVLLNADKVVHFSAAAFLFLSCGSAACFGLLWRYFYNTTYHAAAHPEESYRSNYYESWEYKIAIKAQMPFYFVFVGLSTISLISALVFGFCYIKDYSSLQADRKTTTENIVKSKTVSSLEPSGYALKLILSKDINLGCTGGPACISPS